MALDFPPSDQSPFEAPNGVTYAWDGNKWVAADPANFLPIEGGTLTGDLTVPSLNGGPLGGFRNLLINSCFRVWQRGNPPLSTPSAYTADRWFVNATVGTVERQVNGTPPETTFGFNMTSNGAGNMQVRQGIELDLASTSVSGAPFHQGTQWTFSVWSTQVPSAQFTFKDAVNGSNPVEVLAMTECEFTGQTFGAYTKYSITFTVGVAPDLATNRCLEMRVQHVSTGSDEEWIIAGPQLEPGPVATPFEHRPLSIEEKLCERYYQRISVRNIVINGHGSASSVSVPIRLSTKMRLSQPDCTNRNGDAIVHYSVGRENTASNDNPTLTITNLSGAITLSGALLQVARISGSNTQNLITLCGDNAENQLNADAEL